MNPTIKNFCIKVCKKYGLSSFYLPDRDVYMLHYRGKAIQGFNSTVFYQIPMVAREESILPILKRGLMLNFDENTRNQLYTKRRLGKKIFES